MLTLQKLYREHAEIALTLFVETKDISLTSLKFPEDVEDRRGLVDEGETGVLTLRATGVVPVDCISISTGSS